MAGLSKVRQNDGDQQKRLKTFAKTMMNELSMSFRTTSCKTVR